MQSSRAQELANGTRFGQYEIIRLLGSGGFGAVYEARHTGLEKRVALKTLHRQMAANTEAAARFLREGKAAARIRHPHVVDVSDVGAYDGLPYLVMEFLEGEDLARLMRREGALAVERTVDIIIPVLSAVAAAHDAGVVHRDLKPENIFLVRGRSGLEPKVLDFGISKVLDPSDQKGLTSTQAVLGTPYYMSPEQTTGSRGVDPRTDQYSLGVILFECVTAHKPFDGPTLFALMTAIVQGDVAPMKFFGDIPDAFEAVVRTAMHREAGQRYPSVKTLANQLMPFASPRVRAVWESEFASAAPPARAVYVPPPSNPPAALYTTPPNTPPPGALVPDMATPGSQRPPSIHGDTLAASAAQISGGITPPRAGSRMPWIAGGMALAGAAAIAFALTRSHPAPPATSRPTTPVVAVTAPPPNTLLQLAPTPPAPQLHARVSVVPASATIELDGQPVGVGTWAADLPRDGAAHRLTFRAQGYADQTVEFRDEPPQPSVTLVADEAHAPPAVARVIPPARTRTRPAAEHAATPAARGANRAPIVE